MKIKKLIADLENILKEKGDLEVFSDEAYSISNVSFEDAWEDYPKDYNMPKNGYVIITL